MIFPMSFLSLLFALLLEQARPLQPLNPVHGSVRNWVSWTLRNFDAGKPQHGWLTWGVAVLLPTVLAAAVHWVLLLNLGWLAAVIFNIAILYSTLGFRQFSHHFTEIRDALDAGDEALARKRLAKWMHIDASELPRNEMIRHVIEHSVLSAHRYVFGVFAWYTLLSALGLGPAGAVFYRMAEYFGVLAKRSASSANLILSPSVKQCAEQAWWSIDWLPARITALGFAFVGSFEEAIARWRQFEESTPRDNDGIVLAATAGAVNVQLGFATQSSNAQTPQIAHLRAVVGLVWRTVVMWMIFLALLSLARLLG